MLSVVNLAFGPVAPEESAPVGEPFGRGGAPVLRESHAAAKIRFVLGFLFGAALPSSANAQWTPWPSVHLGLVAQATRSTSESGASVAVAMLLPALRFLDFTPAVQLVGTGVRSSDLSCTVVEPYGCVSEPPSDQIVYLSAATVLRPLPRARLQPTLEGGLAIARILSPDSISQRKGFLAPQVAVGVELRTQPASFLLTLRWRKLDRYTYWGDGSQLGLLLGFRLNRQR